MRIKTEEHKQNCARLIRLALDDPDHPRGFFRGWLNAMERVGVLSFAERSNAEQAIFGKNLSCGNKLDKVWWKRKYNK